MNRMSGTRIFVPLALLLALVPPAGALGQPGEVGEGAQEAVEAYLRGVGEFFDVDPEEVSILGEWRLPADEIPVLVFFARRTGVSADALAALRRNGGSWSDLAGRFGLSLQALHTPLPVGRSGPLSRVVSEYGSLPAVQWRNISLTDEEIIALVNLRFLAGYLEIPPTAVMEGWEGAGSFAGAYRILRGGSDGAPEEGSF
jgi:hypothetical protein